MPTTGILLAALEDWSGELLLFAGFEVCGFKGGLLKTSFTLRVCGAWSALTGSVLFASASDIVGDSRGTSYFGMLE